MKARERERRNRARARVYIAGAGTPALRLAVAAAAAPLSLIEKSAEIENCDRKLQAALGGSARSLRRAEEIERPSEDI